MTKQILNITGTHCQACKKLIERKLSAITGVNSVDVDFETGKTVITADRNIEKEEVNKVLEGMPYAQKD